MEFLLTLFSFTFSRDAQLKAAMEALANTALIEEISQKKDEYLTQIGKKKQPRPAAASAPPVAQALKDTHISPPART